uniref:SWAP70 N-terminal EF-hand domain-containing protein n=1 Tax=Saimiri boliviensis boliviensis TaxID=39432 RepID=A0A2K6TGJ5_SAIBB
MGFRDLQNWKDELLKAIWPAFAALDHDHSGEASKSQLKILSHNLCTVLKVPHEPVALEEHFRDDDDEGPVSNQGYISFWKRSKTTLTRLNSIGCVGPSVSNKTSQRILCSLQKKMHLKYGLFSAFYLRTSIH